MPGALPNLTTIQTKLIKEGFNALEGEFRFNDMEKYMNKINSHFVPNTILLLYVKSHTILNLILLSVSHFHSMKTVCLE